MLHPHQLIPNPKDILHCLKTPHEIISKSCVNEVGDEIRRDTELLTKLEEYKIYNEDDALTQQKEQTIIELREIIIEWINEISQILKITDQNFSKDLKVYGSFPTRSNAREGDIDTVVIGPDWLNREHHFFKILVDKLKQNLSVEWIYTVPDAIVPIMKFKYKGIFIDMTLAQINEKNQPIDDKSMRSMNGLNVAQYFSQTYCETNKFNRVLRLVKLWASNRGLYGGLTGYLGGIAWAILVAKIMQLYPYYTISQLIERFFFIYSLWKWDKLPVIIEEELYENQRCLPSTFMTIITPVQPSINTAYNVSQSTFRVIRQEFIRASQLLQKHYHIYEELFKPLNFFTIHSQFLEIRATATNQLELHAWKGHIESRLRKLTKLLEQIKQLHCQLFPKPFYYQDEEEPTPYKYCVSYFYGIGTTSHNELPDIKTTLTYFAESLECSTFLNVPLTVNLKIKKRLRDQIPKSIINQLQ